MKRRFMHLFRPLLCAVGLGASYQAQAAYTPVTVTGFTADIVANGAGTAMSSTTSDMDGGAVNTRFAFMAPTFVSPTGAVPTSFLPASGLISSVATGTSGLTFQLASYSANNSLRIAGLGTGTLSVTTPQSAGEVYFLASSGNGISTVTVTVTFTDQTTQVFTGQTVADWFGGAGFAIQGIGRVNYDTNVIENSTTDPRLYQVRLAIAATNYTKQIASIGFNKTSTAGTLNVMAVSVNGVCTGTPTAGTAVSNVASVCASTPINLSLTGNSSDVGTTYQWQASTNNGVTWADITGATGATYTTMATVSTQYRARITCSSTNLSATSAPVTITTTSPTYAALPLVESFELTWVDVCATRDAPSNSWRNTPATGNGSWRREDDGTAAAWVNPNSYFYTPNGSQGAHSARFHSGQAANGTIGTFDLFVNLSAAGAKRLSFDFINTSGTDSLVVQLSNDGGVTFSRLAGYNQSGTVATGFVTQVLPIASTSATAVIRFRGRADFGVTDIGLDNIILESATGCLTPATLTATAITANSASLTWLTGGSGTYTVYYGPTGFNPAQASSPTNLYTTAANIVAPPYAVTGLTPSTTYQFYVVQNCGAGANSGTAGPVSFTTACITPLYAALPVNESFENTWISRCDTRDVPTNNWRNSPATGNASWRREDDGVAAAWTSPTVSAYTPTGSQGTHSARFHSYYAGANAVGTFDLFVNLSAAGAKRLSFDYLNTAGNDSLTVQLSNDGGATFARLGRYNLSGTVAQGFVTQVLNVASTSATAVIRFRANVNTTFTSDMGVDNIILESATGCLTPATLAATGITATTATVSWLTGGAGTYTVYYGPTGFNPAQAASTTNVYTTAANLTAPPYAITGLMPSTTYQFYVVQNCGAGSNSGIAGPVSFTTACVTPLYAALPVTESFENTWISRCDTREVPTNNWRNTPVTGNPSWRREDDGTAAAWTLPTSYLYSPAFSQGLHSARFHSGYSTAGLIGTMDLFVNLSAAGAKRLSFDYVNTSGTDSLVIQISNDGGATFSRLAGYNLSGTAATGFVTQVLPIASTSATAVVRFRARADFGSTDIGLDNIILESATGCLTPASLTATTTTTTAALSWLTGGTGTYTVVYGPTGFNPATGGTTVSGLTAPPLALTGLTPGTTYQFYVTLNCGSGTSSGTAGPGSFTTQIVNDDPCGATPLPVNNTCTPLATTTIGATQTTAGVYATGGQGTGCGSIAAPRDVWFAFTTAATGPTSTQARISVTGGAASVVRAYSGTACTGPLTYISCAGTASNTAAPNLDLTGLTPSTTYYVRVNEYSTTGTLGNFTICATPVPNCAVPTGLTAGTSTSTTAAVSWSGTPAAGSTYTVIYGPTGFSPATGGTTVTGITGTSTVLTGLSPLTGYDFYVLQVCGGFNGTSTLAGPATFTTPLTIPGNDEPCGAVALGSTGTVNSSNLGATTSLQNGISLPACGPTQVPKDVWYTVTPSGTSTTLTLTGNAASMVRVFTAPDCANGPFTQVFCQNAPTPNTALGTVVIPGLTARTRYYLAISGAFGADASGNFTLAGTALLATKRQANTEALVVYPNPSNTGQLSISLNGVKGAGQATLLNALGQVVLTKALTTATEQTLTTRGLATGVYTLRVTAADQTFTRKVVLE